jgi:transcriptional regulator with XRE-family HTH domain
MSLLIYRVFMARGGRPQERPAHLTPEQRRQAQQRTKQWRETSHLTQREMALRIGVGDATYRPWENGKDQRAGPTRAQASQLNKALKQLLPDLYVDGEAFDVWGWPRPEDMSYERVVELLRSAGFVVRRRQGNGRPPVTVFWVHRVRKPTLVHGVFSLAAAAATRAGLPVHLLLDDVGLPHGVRDDLCDEFETCVRNWVHFASGDETKLSIDFYSAVLTDEYLTRRGWSAINDYLNTQSSVLEFLRASKAVSPLQYDSDEEESVLSLLRNEESLRADRLLTPLRNWLVIEAEIQQMANMPSAGANDSLITLGGEDEQILWDVWHRGCPDDLSGRVQHLFLTPIPLPSDQTWDASALMVRTNRLRLSEYLMRRTRSDGHFDLVEWILRSAVRFPASLNDGFRGELDPILRGQDVRLRTSDPELPKLVGDVAKAVVDWFTG